MSNELRPDEISREDETRPCPQCNGQCAVDSGGFTPWGTPIDVPCPECDGKGVVSTKCEDPPSLDNWYDE